MNYLVVISGLSGILMVDVPWFKKRSDLSTNNCDMCLGAY